MQTASAGEAVEKEEIATTKVAVQVNATMLDKLMHLSPMKRGKQAGNVELASAKKEEHAATKQSPKEPAAAAAEIMPEFQPQASVRANTEAGSSTAHHTETKKSVSRDVARDAASAAGNMQTLTTDSNAAVCEAASVEKSESVATIRPMAVAGWVKGKYLQQTENTERLAMATTNKLETVAAFGLSKLDALLDDGDETQPRLTVRKPAKSKPADMTEEMVRKGITSGQYKVNYHLWQNIINGVTAGAYISLGGFLACIVGGGLTDINATNPGLGKLIMGLVFPFGLLMVVLTGGELITSSFSTVGAAFLAGIFKVCLMSVGWEKEKNEWEREVLGETKDH